ncbi:nucleotide exchange factor GrpE [Kitasatospora acidiphila]|uniref:Nucleotide exchange factor GrpE n=1 Tax=Kitasatospora acidiphila TaxID=2567942 RepID=A0A540W6T2_9ACTN|nr:nucleotide exchange factor GrpE [Kitasatospora acidiphila]TQF04667.1 nucleotide exchange factor GrpE [Kitasatospora acidiphila]
MTTPPPEPDLDFLKRRCAALATRMERLKDEHRDEKSRLLFSLISVDDALLRTRAWLARVDPEASGLPPGEVVRQLLDQVGSVGELLQLRLREFDVRPLRLLDGHPDTEVADVVELWPTREAEPGTVLEERRRGFLLGAEILRRAEVVVAVEPPPGSGIPAPRDGKEPGRDARRARSHARSARSTARRVRRLQHG